jgi:flavin reductase (DIM6/NTAB) family NADH-FMN oxidoreductase RutF
MTTPSTVDPDIIRAAHRKFVTGVTVVTTDDAGAPRGLAVNAFCSISLEPPQVLVCVQTSSTTYPALLRATHFAVNILAADQLTVATTFAGKSDNKFAAIPFEPGPSGSPWITGCCANFDVEIGDRLRASTHTVFIGRVIGVRLRDAEPLIYHGGSFFTAADLNALTTSPNGPQ